MFDCFYEMTYFGRVRRDVLATQLVGHGAGEAGNEVAPDGEFADER